MNKKKISVVIVDDHLGWLKTLKIYLSSLPELNVIGNATNGHTAIELCEKLHPDLVLLDINMPGLNGFETAETLLAQNPNLWIIGLSADVEASFQQRANKAGFKAVIAKDMLLDYLGPAIHQVM